MQINQDLELAVRCSAKAFLRLLRQAAVSILGSLWDKLTWKRKERLTEPANRRKTFSFLFVWKAVYGHQMS